MKKEELIDFNIRYAWQKIAKMYNAEALKYGLTMSWGFILLNIDEETGTPSTKIGPKMGMEANSLTRIIKNMEKEGFLYRKSDMNDKRLVKLHLTQKGLEYKKIAEANVLTFNNYIYQKISKEKLKQFIDVFKELNIIMDKEQIFNTIQTKQLN